MKRYITGGHPSNWTVYLSLIAIFCFVGLFVVKKIWIENLSWWIIVTPYFVEAFVFMVYFIVNAIVPRKERFVKIIK